MYRRQTEIPKTQLNDWKTLRSLAPFLWDYRGRVLLAIICLILSKVANVGVPLILKGIVDALDASKQSHLAVPLALLAGYGLLRLASSLFNEMRDSIFARVRHGAMRKVATRVLEHLHRLSLRYHLERKTGGISRNIERGTRSVSSLLNYMAFSILPTLVEVSLITGILLTRYNILFAAVALGAVVIYGYFTFRITEWRMKYRIQMNTMDSQANTQAIDSLINYETVKYFGNEVHELHRYNHSLKQWEDAAVKSQTSLSSLNVGQAAIIAVGVTLMMLLASKGVVAGTMTLGDLVLINALLIQLFIPLNFLGIGLRIQMNTMDSQANTQAIDSLINYETVKYFGNEVHELHRYNHSLKQWEDAAVKSQTSLSSLNVGQAAIIAVGVTLMMLLASKGVVAGTMTLGDLVLINALLIQLFIPLNFLGIVYSQLKHAIVDMQAMFDVLELEPEVQDKPDARRLDVGAGGVAFEHVSFAYDSDRPILHDISLEIPAGSKVAVVGPSGAGKSTLARLLFRFYDVQSGCIMINGQDIRDVTQASLRQAIGIVPQDTVLFNDTLYYNISYASPGATQQQVEQAARTANIHEFIISLPKGYDTLVGERGLKLSGGEKQRVAIARAILKNPRILVFDEATSSLDSASEKVILETLRLAAEHHTTLVIAHRLSTVVDADEILVMENGRIIERGSHQRLLAQQGVYTNLWELQKKEEP